MKFKPILLYNVTYNTTVGLGYVDEIGIAYRYNMTIHHNERKED